MSHQSRVCDPLCCVATPSMTIFRSLSRGHWPVPFMACHTVHLGSLLTPIDGLIVTSVSSLLSALYVVDLKKFRKIAAGVLHRNSEIVTCRVPRLQYRCGADVSGSGGILLRRQFIPHFAEISRGFYKFPVLQGIWIRRPKERGRI